MRCTKCGHTLRCIRCGTSAPNESHSSPDVRTPVGGIQEELQKRCVMVEISRGVMRHVLLLSDVEELLTRMSNPPPSGSLVP